MSGIVYACDPRLTVDEYIDVVGHSDLGATLGEEVGLDDGHFWSRTRGA